MRDARDRRRAPGDGPRRDRPARGATRPASSTSSRSSLLPRDPADDGNVILEIRAGRRRRRGGPVRRRAAPDVPALRRQAPLQDRGHARSTRPASAGSRRRSSRSAGDGAYSPAQVRGRHPPRPARPGDRVVRAGSTPRPRRSSCCPRSRRTRSRSTRTATCGSRSSARRARAASRSTRPTRRSGSPTCRPAWSSRSRTRRASTRTRPRRWPSCAPGCSRTSERRSSARPTRRPAGR